MADDEFLYRPAKRAQVSVLIMLAGPSGSGKTKSALRLATGLANGGTIGFCDTEHGRASYYAAAEGQPAAPPETFDFHHLELKEPFSPDRFEKAAVTSQKAGHVVWVCDSFSHEHYGPGGILDMQEAELQRMAKDDWDKRERMKFTAWIRPKVMHKHLVQRLWQLNSHIILCCHADKKLALEKDPKDGKIKPVDKGFSPVCSPDIPYAMTASFMLSPERPGVPIWLKHFDKLAPLINTEAPLDEETGRRIAAWAKGQPAGAAQSNGDQTPRGDAKNRAVADELIAKFQATQTRRDHMAIVDDAANRSRIEWFREKRPELFEQVNQALKESWQRTEVKEGAL